MRKTYALLIVLSVLTGLVLIPEADASGSNPYWIEVYKGSFLVSPSPVLSVSGGGVILVSYVKENGMVKYSVLRKIASDGSVEWAVKYGNGLIINALAETPDGRIVAAGTYLSDTNMHSDGFLMEMDKNGKVLWAKRYGGNGMDSLSVVTVLKNGDILAAGMTASFKDARGDVWLIKTDGHGNVIWERTYGTEWKDEPLSMMVEPNWNILIAGVSVHGNVPYGMIMSVDGSGNPVWVKEYQSGGGLVIRGLSYSNGDIYASGYNYLGNGTLGAFLMKLDGNGNVLWGESYYRGGFFMLGGNIGADSRGLWLPGAMINASSTETTYYGVILHVHNDTLRDVRVYGPGISFRAVTIAPDGSLLLSGVTKNNTPLMARLPANGSLPNCKYLISVKVEKTSVKIRAFPITLNIGDPNFNAVAVAVSTFKTSSNPRFLCTYSRYFHKEKGICGPGLVVLMALSIVVLLRKR